MVNRRRVDVAVGISAELRHAAENATLRIRARPETAVTDVRLIDTGRLRNIDTTVTYGADLYASLGPVAATGEFIRLQIARTGAPDLTMQGFTVGAAWMLTGEHRGYRTSTAAMQGITPRHGWGALELAARLSTLDLEQDLPGSGKQQDRTLALNWYWTANTRIAFNYVQVKAEPNRNGRNESPSLMQLRLQLAL
jgi:phosphate-selective porin OprO/OprP